MIWDTNTHDGANINNKPAFVTLPKTDPGLTSGTATGVTFGGDASGDRVKDGIAFLHGAGTPDENAKGRLQIASEDGGLVMNFTMLDAACSAPAVLKLSHSSNLGINDPWSAPVAAGGCEVSAQA